MTEYNATVALVRRVTFNVTDATETRGYYHSGAGPEEDYAARMIFLVLGPAFLIFGSAGNILSLMVLRSGEFKELSTCFYMSVLAVMDTGEFSLDFFLCRFPLLNWAKQTSNCKEHGTFLLHP